MSNQPETPRDPQLEQEGCEASNSTGLFSVGETPETDRYEGTWATEYQGGLSIFEHARKLERDRDTWKARARAAEQVVDELHDRHARIRAGIESKISTTNIPLSAARVWVEALTQALEVMDSENDQLGFTYQRSCNQEE